MENLWKSSRNFIRSFTTHSQIRSNISSCAPPFQSILKIRANVSRHNGPFEKFTYVYIIFIAAIKKVSLWPPCNIQTYDDFTAVIYARLDECYVSALPSLDNYNISTTNRQEWNGDRLLNKFKRKLRWKKSQARARARMEAEMIIWNAPSPFSFTTENSHIANGSYVLKIINMTMEDDYDEFPARKCRYSW